MRIEIEVVSTIQSDGFQLMLIQIEKKATIQTGQSATLFLDSIQLQLYST